MGTGVLLHWPRETLYERINERVLIMLSAGLLDEVRRLGSVGPTAGKAIGLQEMQAHLAGEMPLAEAVEAMQQATRRYAKRQVTWFKREQWLQTICLNSEAAAESALDQILVSSPCLQLSLRPSRSPSI